MVNKQIISVAVGLFAFLCGLYCNKKIGQENELNSYIVSPPYLSESRANETKRTFLYLGGKKNLHDLLFFYRDKGYPYNQEILYFNLIAANRFDIDEGYKFTLKKLEEFEESTLNNNTKYLLSGIYVDFLKRLLQRHPEICLPIIEKMKKEGREYYDDKLDSLLYKI